MIIVVANSKGGVGKSTIAVHLAAWLHEQGHQVTLADRDTQHSSSDWLREALPEVKEGGTQLIGDFVGVRPALLITLGKRCFGLPQVAQGFLPPTFKLAGDQPIIRIALLELSFGECRTISQTLDLLCLCTSRRHLGLMTVAGGASQDIEFGGLQVGNRP